jgi:pSer/pThr/pTyr-binding forkhead associated (FHA) protein
MWLLETSADAPEPLTFRILPGGIKTVGRAARADFVVDAPLVSRLHCRLTLQPDGLLVEDLESTNGTFVNGERVRTLLLRSGDALRVGRVEFSVREAAGG